MATPVVSVCMITYNHAPFIRQAVESALMQQSEFDFEIVIAEDCSTDETGDICQELADRHPDRIRLLRQSTNRGMYANLRDCYASCRGEYVAMLEGDDYWTDASKLRRQVDAMESHLEWVICAHPVVFTNLLNVDETDGIFPTWPDNDLLEYDFRAIVSAYLAHTASMLFRRSALPLLPEWLLPGDWPIQVMLARRGKMGLLPNVMATHRLHAGGVSAGASAMNNAQREFDWYSALENHLEPEYAALVRGTRNRAITLLYQRLEHQQELLVAYNRSRTFRLGAAIIFPFQMLRSILASLRLCFGLASGD